MNPYLFHLIIEVILGFGIGYTLCWLTHDTKPVGTLKIDTSDPETDRYLMVFTAPLEDIPKKKRIVMRVDPNATLESFKEPS